jgi:prolyl 4-hydroxylase
LHVDPLVLAVDDFFTDDECDRYVGMTLSQDETIMSSRSPTVGKDARSQAQRTSTTWYHRYELVAELLAKATRLLGLPTIARWEEPQIVRYRRGEQFTWHLDALGPAESDRGRGGQRTATLLVYLTGLKPGEGGATVFRDLRGTSEPSDEPAPAADPRTRFLKVQPRKGSALLFFPSAGGIQDAPLDLRTLHCGEAVSAEAVEDKWIAQMWLREGIYRPTAPPGNCHEAGARAVRRYTAELANANRAAGCVGKNA